MCHAATLIISEFPDSFPLSTWTQARVSLAFRHGAPDDSCMAGAVHMMIRAREMQETLCDRRQPAHERPRRAVQRLAARDAGQRDQRRVVP